MIENGVMEADAHPSFYIFTMKMAKGKNVCRMFARFCFVDDAKCNDGVGRRYCSSVVIYMNRIAVLRHDCRDMCYLYGLVAIKTSLSCV